MAYLSTDVKFDVDLSFEEVEKLYTTAKRRFDLYGEGNYVRLELSLAGSLEDRVEGKVHVFCYGDGPNEAFDL